MAKPFRLSLCICLWFLTCACLASLDERLNECQLDRLNALEPDNRIESEGGVTETWNSNHPELRCAGVTLVRRTIYPNGLHLPSYANYPQFIMIVQGEGAIGIPLPGCSGTYEEPRSQARKIRRILRRGFQQQQGDSHQKIHHFKQGHIIVIPPGIPYWSYNYGNEKVIAITLLDTTNFLNQLDPNPRRFYLAGNPEEEHPETQQQQQQQQQQREQRVRPGGRKSGQHQQEEEQSNNVLSGFNTRLLAQAFAVDEEVARRLQNPREQKDQIVRVEGGLRAVISPLWGEEDEEEEEEGQEGGGRGPGRRPGRPGRWEEQAEEYREDEPRYSRERRPHGQRPRGQQGREYDEDERRPGRQEYEEEEEQPWRWRPPGQQGREYDEDERRSGGQGHRREKVRGQEEEEEEEEQEQGWPPRGQQGRGYDEDEPYPRRPSGPGKGQRGQEEEEEEEEEYDRRRWIPYPYPGRRHGQQREQEEEEEGREGGRIRQREKWRWRWRWEGEEGEEEEGGRCNGKKLCRLRNAFLHKHGISRNGLEGTHCSAKLIGNIARPSRADLYNPKAGRISEANSLTLPILRWFQLSAEYVVLYRNGIYAPHWNINANSVIYVIRGQGRVQVVNCQGKLVFNGVLTRGQILVVPQNFVVAEQAGNEGFEYVAFKTNDRASTNPLKQVLRAIPAEVLINAFGLCQHQVSTLKNNGNQSPLVSADSQYEPGGRALAQV